MPLECQQSQNMVIARERYLDDTRRFHLELALTTRHTAMHSLLSSLSAEERDAIGDVLVRSLDEIAARLQALREAGTSR